MKTVKTIAILCLLFLTYSCSSSDDDSSETPSTENLLTSGIWYLESKTPGSFTACEKKSSFEFKTDNTAVIANFEVNSGTCEAIQPVTGTYTLNGSSLVLTRGSETISTTINSITSNELSLTDPILFDKTQG